MDPVSLPEVYRAHLAAAAGGDAATLRAIWEPDGVVEFPYAVSVGTPTRLTGIDAIVDYFGGLSLFGPFAFSGVAAWPLGDGDWVAELHGSSTVLATGQPYEQDYVVRFRVSPAGRLSWLREYWDPTRLGPRPPEVA
jgi:uncharacterized protein